MKTSSSSSSRHMGKTPEERAQRCCGELVALLDPVLVKTLPDPALWQQVPRNIATYLVHTCAPSPWFNHLALASAIYASSRVVDPRHCVENVHRFFSWAIPEHFPDLGHLAIEQAIIAYFGDPPQTRGANLFKSYHAIQIHLERFLASLTPEQRAALTPFLLPALPYSPILKRLTVRSDEKTRRTRKEKTFAVVKRLPELVGLARRRYRWLSELDLQLQQVATAAQRGDLELPTLITSPNPEGSEKLCFRVWNRASWLHAHAAMRPPKTTPRTYLPRVSEPLFLQYVGELAGSPWFLRAMACGALQGPPSRSAEARQYGTEWGVGQLACDEPGLLTPHGDMNAMLHWARQTAAGTAEDSRIVFCLEPLLAAAAVGLFVLVSAVSTGMRIGELQQLTLDRECMEMLDLPEYDDESGQWRQSPPRLYWRLYPKDHPQRERYLVTPHMSEAMFILLDLHKRFHGERRLVSIRCGLPSQFSHAHRFPGQHCFVLQWGGRHLCIKSLTRCVQFLLLEHGCRDERDLWWPKTPFVFIITVKTCRA